MQLQPLLVFSISCLVLVVWYTSTHWSPPPHHTAVPIIQQPHSATSSSPSSSNTDPSMTPEWSQTLNNEMALLREEIAQWRGKTLGGSSTPSSTLAPSLPQQQSCPPCAATPQQPSAVAPAAVCNSSSPFAAADGLPRLSPMDINLPIGNQWSQGPFAINLDKRSSVLVAILTLNHWNEVERLLYSMLGNDDHETYDVILLDDGSFDDTVEKAKTFGLTILSNAGSGSVGVTAKWNEAYAYFRKNHYQKLFILNNDILIPNGCIPKLAKLLDSYLMAVPMSSRLGVGHVKAQAIELVYPGTVVPFVHTATNFRTIQRWLDAKFGAVQPTHIVLKEFNGFFFGVARGIKRAAFSDNQLFDPATINIGNEIDLTRRLQKASPPITVGLCTNCYAFHYKAVTTVGTRVRNGEDRDNLNAIREHELKMVQAAKGLPTAAADPIIGGSNTPTPTTP